MPKPIRVPRARPRKKKPARAEGRNDSAYTFRDGKLISHDSPGLTPCGAFRKAIYTMPDEALGWLMLAISQQQVWPDGLGGFKPESRAAIQAVLAAVARVR